MDQSNHTKWQKTSKRVLTNAQNQVKSNVLKVMETNMMKILAFKVETN